MTTRHQCDARVMWCDQTHFAVVIIRLWRVDDLTVCLAVGRTVSCSHISVVDFIWTIFLLQEYVPCGVDIPFTNYRQRLDLTFKAAVQTVNAHLNENHTFPKFLFPPFSCLVFSCLAFSLPVFSCHAVWCRIFMSRIFMPHTVVLRFHVLYFHATQYGAAFSCLVFS